MLVVTALQMNEVDRYLIEKDGFTIRQLVEIASGKLLEALGDKEVYLLLVGPGNNGADALSLAKRLIDLEKIVKVKLFYFEKANNIVRYFYEQVQDKIELVEEDIEADVIVDGIFGNGLNRILDEELQIYLKKINQLKTLKVAIDIPTGINATTGLLQATAFKANKTVTFMCLKLAMLNHDLKEYFGDIDIKGFGIEEMALRNADVAEMIDEKMILNLFKLRRNNDHKGTHGKIIHFTGCKSYKGAACLASLASVHCGSGIVKVCSEEAVLELVGHHNLEAITELYHLDNDVLKGQNAILCGCGSGWNEQTYKTLTFLLKESKIPLVIDADGINVISEHLELLAKPHGPVIMTPHLGEFNRLCPQYDNIESAIATFANTYNVVMVVKGPNTIVYGNHQFYRNTTGNPGMATAGMGDVLAGMISSFCGQEYTLLDAAKLGVYLHGKCGDQLYSDNFTVLPHELIKKIPNVMKELSDEKDFDWNNESF